MLAQTRVKKRGVKKPTKTAAQESREKQLASPGPASKMNKMLGYTSQMGLPNISMAK